MSARLYGLVLSIKYGVCPLVRGLISFWVYVSAVDLEFFASIKGVVVFFIFGNVCFLVRWFWGIVGVF